MSARALTDLSIQKLRADPACRLEVPDRLCPGLYLVVQPSGRRGFAVRTRVGGRPVKLTLGPYPAVSLSQARERAQVALAAALKGQDPRELPEAVPVLTVQAAVDEFILRYAKPRLRGWKDVQNRLQRDLCRLYGKRPLESIGKVDVVRMLDDVCDRGAPHSANRVLASVKRLFGWAVDRGILTVNHAAGVKMPTALVRRDKVLTDDELKAIWLAADSLGFPWCQTIRMMACTGVRGGEAAALRLSDVDLDAKVWTLPPELTKANRAHPVPLSPLAMEIINTCPRLHDDPAAFLFSRKGHTKADSWAKLKRKLDAASGVSGWRLHDLRRTCATGLAELGTAPHVLAAVLGHAPASTMGVTSIYNRFGYAAEQRQALDAWSRHLQRLLHPEPGTVVQLRRAGA